MFFYGYASNIQTSHTNYICRGRDAFFHEIYIKEMRSTMEEKGHNSIQVIDRALDIIELLSVEQKGLGVTEISKRTHLHKSTAYRIVTSLCSRGYIEKDKNGEYTIGRKLIEIASFHIDNLELQTEARPYLRELSSQYNLTSHLGVLDGWHVVYIEKLDVFSRFGLYSKIGYRVPAYCSSLGKCLLSCLSDIELEDTMATCPFERFTENTITDLPTLKKHLRNVRAQGWAMDDQEHDIGQRCIGAPIYDYRGEMIASLSVSGTIEQITDEKILPIAKHISKIGIEISKRLGYTE
jgi:DNA-binding IclR family transcriptional regulator